MVYFQVNFSIGDVLWKKVAKKDLVVRKIWAQRRLKTPDLVFRDPYVLEFLNLNDHYMEKDLEDAFATQGREASSEKRPPELKIMLKQNKILLIRTP